VAGTPSDVRMEAKWSADAASMECLRRAWSEQCRRLKFSSKAAGGAQLF
jgi:hypothetical protein